MTHLDDYLVNSFKNDGFESLTRIQQKSFPVICRKKNCLLVAPTGSGKTEASSIPVFSLLQMANKTTGQIKVIYVTPLRALNNDVLRRVVSYAERRNLKVEIRHGDTTTKKKKEIITNPPHILITTPESLGVILTNDKFQCALKELEWIIIDEVHELIGNKRGSHLSISLERLQNISNKEIVRIGLSATLANLDEGASFVGGLKKCSILVDSSMRNYDVEVKYVKGTMNSIASYVLDYIKSNNIFGSVLLFTNTRDESEYIGSTLRNQKEIPVDVHHGSLSKEMREETETRLRSGKAGIVVCTSSLELGLDIGSVELVIHYGSPKQVSKLIQRIGRSRHNSKNSAKGLIITNSLDDELEVQAIIKRMKHRSMETQIPHFNALDVVAHHVVGMALSNTKPQSVSEIFEIIKKSYLFKDLSFFDYEQCLSLLDGSKTIRYDRVNQKFSRRLKSYKYYFENLSTIPLILKFEVMDIIRKKRVGLLDQQFVGEYGERGNVFVLKGSQWRIVNIDEKKMQINVEQIMGSQINIPHWVGEMIPVDMETANEVGNFRNKAMNSKMLISGDMINILKELSVVPDPYNIAVENVYSRNSIVIHSTFGTKVNNTLASLMSTIISSHLGYIVEVKSDPYRILLSSTARIGNAHIEKVFFDEYDVESVIIASLSGTYNLNWRVWNISKKFGLIDKEAIYDKRVARMIYDRYSRTPISKESIRELLHDKFDAISTSKLLSDIQDQKVKIHYYERPEFSSLANPITEHGTRFSASPLSIEQGLLELVKERLEKTKHRLICIRCGQWQRLLETNEIGKIISCRLCGSRLVTTTFASDYDLPRIIINKLKGVEITKEENHKFERAWKTASLVNNFGKKAIVVLSGHGIGVDTAARLLRNYIDEDQIYRSIYDAERQYVLNRGFWNDD